MFRLTANLFPVCVASLFASALVAAAERDDGMNVPQSSGGALYIEYCAICHGSDARGDGPLAATLSVAPPNLRRLAVLGGGIFPTERVRQHIDGRNINPAHGNREMPVWGSAFKRARGAYGERRVEQRLDSLTDYLHSIQEAQ